MGIKNSQKWKVRHTWGAVRTCTSNVYQRRVSSTCFCPMPFLFLSSYLSAKHKSVIISFRCSRSTWFHFLYHTISFIIYGLGTKIRCHPRKYKARPFLEERNQFSSLNFLQCSSRHHIHQAGTTHPAVFQLLLLQSVLIDDGNTVSCNEGSHMHSLSLM